jgi:hypothetical protein
MMFKHRLASLAAVVTIAIAAPALANPSFKIAEPKGASVLVERTHGWHRTCKRGLNGWHRHVPGVGRIQCTTRRNGVWY